MLYNTLTINPQPSPELPRRGGLARFIDIIVTVVPIGADKFEVRQGGRVLIRASRTPFCDAARRLIAEGHPPGSVLAMRRLGEADFALRSKLGQATKLTVDDTRYGTPRLRRWRPPPGAGASPPVRSSPQNAPTPPSDKTMILGAATC
jgi:hypothetical protein